MLQPEAQNPTYAPQRAASSSRRWVAWSGVWRAVRVVLLAAGVFFALRWMPERQVHEEPVSPPDPTASPVEPLTVTIEPPALPDHRWALEAAGHVLLLLEAGLAEAPGVVPRVAGAVPPPGLANVLSSARPPWRLALDLRVDDTTVAFEATLCDPADACTRHRAAGPRTAPGAAVAEVVAALTERLGRPLPIPLAHLEAPETNDPYAALLLGRAAAVATGLRPPADPAHVGDVRRDPVARAVFLDPRMGSAQAIVARTHSDPGRRLMAARAAAAAQPWSLLRAADLAAVSAEAGLPDAAREAWRDVASRSPRDGRFVLARVDAALAVGDGRGAGLALAELRGRYADVPEVVAVQVRVADALGGAEDALLARWQEVAADDPEPVRRRIALRVAEGRREEALALTAELAARGAREEASRLTLALASDLGRWEQAAGAATDLGASETARRLAAARRAPDEIVAVLAEARSPEARLARARALLDLGRADEALADVEVALAVDPWWPEALDVRARALEALGDEAEAAATRERLRRADPAWALPPTGPGVR